jgi:hypothetical protein
MHLELLCYVVGRMIGNSKLPFTLFIVFIMMSSVFIGALWNSTDFVAMYMNQGRNSLSNVNSIVIDGNLSMNEWSNALHKVEWFMDADASNLDGYNYLYIDEDPYNLYIALDLCSDQTNESSGEWVGLWFNTNYTESQDYLDWESALDRGMESLLHDVDNDEIMKYFTNEESWVYSDPLPWIAVNGTFEGGLSDIEIPDDVYLEVTSEYNGSHYTYRMDIDVDIHDFYYMFKQLYVEQTSRLELTNHWMNNVTIDDHFLSISDNQGNLNPDIKIPLNKQTNLVAESHIIFKENFTSDTTVRLSLNGVNDAPFKTSIDFQIMRVFSNETNYIAEGWACPYASIRNYDIAWSFGPSENNASDHRSFEFKIPKSELEGYEMDTDLGIITGGYGTLATFPNTHNWVFQKYYILGLLEENSTEYNNFPMPMKGWTPPSSPVLDAISPNPNLDGNVLVNWNDDPAVANWTLYRYSSEITDMNLESATEIASGLTESQYNDTGLSDGLYWYTVEAIDSFGFSYLSNSVNVTVELPVTTPTGTTETTGPTGTTPPPISPQLLLILIGFGIMIVLVCVFAIIRKR